MWVARPDRNGQRNTVAELSRGSTKQRTADTASVDSANAAHAGTLRAPWGGARRAAWRAGSRAGRTAAVIYLNSYRPKLTITAARRPIAMPKPLQEHNKRYGSRRVPCPGSRVEPSSMRLQLPDHMPSTLIATQRQGTGIDVLFPRPAHDRQGPIADFSHPGPARMCRLNRFNSKGYR